MPEGNAQYDLALLPDDGPIPEKRSCRKAFILLLIWSVLVPLALFFLIVATVLSTLLGFMGAFTKERIVKFMLITIPIFLCETIRENILYHIGFLNKAQMHPPERLADNLWSMTYYSENPHLFPLPLWTQIKCNCLIWREIGGSKLVLISPPPPTKAAVKMIAALGKIALAVSPGNGHDMNAHKWSELVEGCQTSCFKELDHEPELKEWDRRVDVYSEDVLAPLGIRWHIVPPGVFAGARGIKTKNSRKPFKEAIIQLPIQKADHPSTYALVFQDTLQNSRCIRKQSNPLISAYQALILWLYGLYGFRVTRLFQTAFVGNPRLLKEFILEKLCTLQDISMLLPLHGPPITEPGVLDTLKEAVSNLR